jgi:hypothetical protein
MIKYQDHESLEVQKLLPRIEQNNGHGTKLFLGVKSESFFLRFGFETSGNMQPICKANITYLCRTGLQ